MARPSRLLVLLALLLALPGCGDSDRLAYANEADEPNYREGQALLKSGRRQEALSAFLKVIDRRGEDAPESHLEAGLIYQQHISDPLSAIFHFKKYLALRPNSPQAPLVRQRIDACIRDFARTLPAQPLEAATQRVDLVAAMDKLKLENDLLKQQLADLQAGREPTAAAPPDSAASVAPATRADAGFNLNLDAIPTVRTRPARAEPPPAKASSAKPGAAPAKGTPAPAGARKHTVQRGDTLSNLAQKYYGNRAKWHDIFNANRKVMRNEGDLHVGQELVIP